MAEVKLRGPELDPPAPKLLTTTDGSAGSGGAAAAGSNASTSSGATPAYDTVVCVIAASGVVQHRVEPNIEAMSEHGLIVLDQSKMEIPPATVKAFAVLPVIDARQAAADAKARQPIHGARSGPGTEIAIELANIPDAKNLAVELYVARGDKSIATQTETVADNANPKFHTTLFVPAHPFEADSKADEAGHTDSDVDYELRVFNRLNAVKPSPADLLAVVILDAKRLGGAGSFSVPLTNASDTSLDTKLKHNGAVITVRTASSSTTRAIHRPDRVVIHVTAHNLPVAPPPKPTGAAAVQAAQAAAAAAAAGIPAPPEPLGHSVVAVLTPVVGGDSQKTEAIVGVANPTFHVPFSVPNPDQVMTANPNASLYDLRIYAASTDPDVIAAQAVAAAAAAKAKSAAAVDTKSAPAAGSGGAATTATAQSAFGDLLAVIRVDLNLLLTAPAGCKTFRLVNSKTTELAPDEQTVRVAPGSKSWADKLAAADASVTIVGVTNHPSEEGTYHQSKDELADIRAFTSGPCVCLLVRGENAFAKLTKLKEEREIDHMYFSADSWCALRDSLLLFPARHGGASGQPVERTLAFIKPGTGPNELDAVIRTVVDEPTSDFVVIAREKRVIDSKLAKALGFTDPAEITYLGSDVSEVLVLEAPGAVDAWQLLMGPEDPAVASRRAPTSLRGRFGRSKLQNLVYGSPTASKARADIAVLFPKPFPLQRTLAIFKPDACDQSGDAMLRIATEQFGFTVLSKERLKLSKARAELFYAEHAGKPFFNSLVEFMSSGPIMALVLTKPAAILSWRKLIGPTKRIEALRLRPQSLRARFGHSDTQNACHGSADVNDSEREIQFFFPQLPSENLPTDVEQLKAIFNAKPFAARGPHARAPKSLNDVLVDGLTALCRERPLKLDAVKWLGNWLLKNNPNQPSVEHVASVAPDAKSAAAKSATGKSIVGGDVKTVGTADRDEKIAASYITPASGDSIQSGVAAPPAPRKLIWVVGGPGVGKFSLCQRLAKEFGYEHINVGVMLRANCKAGSDYAELLTDCMLNGRVVPSAVVVALLQHAMRTSTVSSTGVATRWIISDFPHSLDQAFDFEGTAGSSGIGVASQMIYLSVANESTLTKRIENRVATTPANAQRADDKPDSVQKRLALFREDVVPQVVGQFRLFPGKVKEVSADGSFDEVYTRLKQLFEVPKVTPVAANGSAAAAGGAVSPSRSKSKKPIVAAAPAPAPAEFLKISG